MRIIFLSVFLSFTITSISQLPPRLFIDNETRKFGYQDPKTKATVIEPSYELASPFVETDKWGVGKSEYLAAVQLSGKSGFINPLGKVVIPLSYDSVRTFAAGFAAVKKNDKWGFIDAKGKPVIALQFENAGAFATISTTKKLGPVRSKGKWGFCDASGKMVIDFQFEDARSFEYAKAAVKKNNSWGYIDETGKLVIPYEYDYAGQFIKYDTTVVGKGKLVFLINNKGEKLANPAEDGSLVTIRFKMAQDDLNAAIEKEKRAKLPLQNNFYRSGFGYSSPQKDLDKKAQEVWDAYISTSKNIAAAYSDFNKAWENYFFNGKDSATLRADKTGSKKGLYDQVRILMVLLSKNIDQFKTLGLNPGDNLLADAYTKFLAKQKDFLDEVFNLISYIPLKVGGWKNFETGMNGLQSSLEQQLQSQKELYTAAEQSVRRNKISIK